MTQETMTQNTMTQNVTGQPAQSAQSAALNTATDRFAVKQEVPIDPKTGKPYLNTVAAIQVSVTGAGSEVSPYVSQAIEVIRDSGLPQETNALFTDVEGDLDEVLHVAGEAAKKLAGQGYRTSLVLHMDIRPGFTGQLTEKPQLADKLIAERKAANATPPATGTAASAASPMVR